jgi:hypothetical protein
MCVTASSRSKTLWVDVIGQPVGTAVRCGHVVVRQRITVTRHNVAYAKKRLAASCEVRTVVFPRPSRARGFGLEPGVSIAFDGRIVTETDRNSGSRNVFLDASQMRYGVRRRRAHVDVSALRKMKVGGAFSQIRSRGTHQHHIVGTHPRASRGIGHGGRTVGMPNHGDM